MSEKWGDFRSSWSILPIRLQQEGSSTLQTPPAWGCWASSSLFKGVSTCFRWRFRQHLARGTLPWCWLEGNPNQKRSSRIDSSLYAKCVVTHYFFSMQQSVLCRAWRNSVKSSLYSCSGSLFIASVGVCWPLLTAYHGHLKSWKHFFLLLLLPQ